MKLTHLFFWVTGAIFFGMGCATSVPTTMNKSWEKEIAFNDQQTEMHLTQEGETVTLISPKGIETLDASGSSIYNVDREKFFRTYISTTRGYEEITDKIRYIYLPHRHALLEFNYSMTAESLTLINLDNHEISWINDDLKWSLERYQVLMRSAAKGLNVLNQNTADAASEVMLPERFVSEMTKVIPELDAFLFKTLDGLKLINLENGETLWTNEEVKGGIAKMFYDSASHSIVAVNTDSDAFQLDGLQFNKQIIRLDAGDGTTIWENSYEGDIRKKLDGFGIWADREADIRLLDDVVMLNFLNVEMFDFETGENLWKTTEGANRMMDLVAPSSQIMNLFAYPVVHGDHLYRVGFENVGLTGVDIIIEAFQRNTGEEIWKTDKLSRSKPVTDIVVTGDQLVVSYDDKVAAVALDNGEKLWEQESLGEIRDHMVHTDQGIIAAGSDGVGLLIAETGETKFIIDTNNNGPGDVQDLLVGSDGIAVTGEKGFAIYEKENGNLLQQVSTPTGGLMTTGTGRLLISPAPNYGDPVYPVDGAFHLLDYQNGKLLGTLGTDKNRRAWTVDKDFSSMYVLTGSKLVKYQAQ